MYLNPAVLTRSIILGKVKLSHLEGRGRTAPAHFKLRIRWGLSGSRLVRALILEKDPQYQFYKRLGGSQNQPQHKC